MSGWAPSAAGRPTQVMIGVDVGTPVVVGAADGPLGNLRAGALAPGVVGLSLGTSGAVRIQLLQALEAVAPLFPLR